MNELGMREYVCHKRVKAAKILNVVACPNGIAMLEFDPPKEGNHRDVSQRVLQARTGCDNMRTASAKAKTGYWVIYDDGYESWSPAAAFEAGYTPT